MFGFPEVGHRKFKKNFLKTVIFDIQFDQCVGLKDKSKEIGELFKDNFPRFSPGQEKGIEILIGKGNTNFNETNSGHNISLKSNDGQRIINISEKKLSLVVGGNSYESFENLMEDFEKVISFLGMCNISYVKRLAIRKINIVEFKNLGNPSEILAYLLNPLLINHINEFPNVELINHSIQSVNYNDGNNYLNIKYGLNMPPQMKSERGQLVIDIDLFKQDQIDTPNILPISNEINLEIFNIFNWLINETAKNDILNG